MKQLSKSLRSIKRLSRMGCITLSLMLIGSAIAQGIPGTSFSRQSTVGETYNLKNTQIAADQSRIIFYRPTHARTGETSTIYIVGLFSKLSHFPHLSRQSLSHVQHILLIF
ncbi:hypothetical protein [Limnohabitans lacus]|uniref:Uncharacterized protein n=1 Tax=Limnohabitans lacus TaxID=3045173 RepID=A0ABT6X8B0_9BURK|nr:hypothetical protein [Limnohabitans sp. HM2-2]MDI9234369.1 hypothetical protein [Limnohabitans sp. HM2-2]